MKKTRAIVGLCMLCALLVSAFAAKSASAVTKGTTAFTCVKGQAPANLWGEHCLGSNPGGGEKQEYGHKEFAANVTTHATETNEKTKNGTKEATPGVLATTVGGVALKFTVASFHTTDGAWIENKTTAAGEHYVHGEGKLLLKGVTVTEPANCKIVSAAGEGTVETEQLTVTTEGQGDNALLKPASGTTWLIFSIQNNGGVCGAAQENIKIVGSLKGQPDQPGATVTFTHTTTTTEGTLRFGSAVGPKVGLEGKLTYTAGEGKSTEGKPTNPTSATTVETP